MAACTAVRSIHAVLACAALTIGAPAWVGVTAARQSAVGVMPNWGDLETWSRPLTTTREVEQGLGLHLGGADGTILMSFSGRIDMRSTTSRPNDIMVVVAPPPMGNPNIVRTTSLRFVVDEGSNRTTIIDLTSGLMADDPAPGAILRSATGLMRPADLVKLAQAEKIQANALGSVVTFRPDQVKALIALAGRLRIDVPPPAQ